MIRLIDNTLTALDNCMPSKEDLHTFCELLSMIGVDVIELSVSAFQRMEYLPDTGKYILHIGLDDEMVNDPGFYRYVCHHEIFLDKFIYEIQMNDAREIVKLRALRNYKELRIVGLDDLMCNTYEKIMQEMKSALPGSTIIFCPENTYGCASALAVQWLLGYGNEVTTSFAGIGNNAATEEVTMALRLAARYKPNKDLSVLPKLTSLFEKFINKPVGNKKPIIGKNIFKVEAGIHADGIMKNPATYEAYHPECVGGKSEIVIGKHSGSKAVILKMEELGLPGMEEPLIDIILQIVKQVCTQGNKSLSDAEFAQIVKQVKSMEVKPGERKKIYC